MFPGKGVANATFTNTKTVASGYWFCFVLKETDERPEMTSIAQNNMGTFSIGVYFIPVELNYAGTISHLILYFPRIYY